MYIAKCIIIIFLAVYGSNLISMAGVQLTEKEILNNHYASLCSTLTDIDNLLPFFVQESVISVSDLEEINACKTMRNKVQKLLLHISCPLQAGDASGFRKMLTIMEEHGIQCTKDLAVKMSSNITTSNIKRMPEG